MRRCCTRASHRTPPPMSRINGPSARIVFFPEQRRLEMDMVSTMGECTPESQESLLAALRARFPGLRSSRRRLVAARRSPRRQGVPRAGDAARRADGRPNLDRTKVAIDRLQTISSLMEKESRVASWGARTVMTPMLAVAGFLTYTDRRTVRPRWAPIGRLDPVRRSSACSAGRFSITVSRRCTSPRWPIASGNAPRSMV